MSLRTNNCCLLLLLALALLSGCDTGLKQLGPTEHGVVFNHLPRFIGGGVSHHTIRNAQKAVVWPWQSIYRVDTSEKYISWGPNTATQGGLVYTRALDGNEVALAITVVYQVLPEPEALVRLIEELATSDQEIRALVVAIARADIRTHMNTLRTSHFADRDQRYKAVDSVRDAMNKRLAHYGIRILRVNLDDFQFERLLPSGKIDSSYQEMFTQIQQRAEDTEREKARRETVKTKKDQELEAVRGQVKRQTAEAEGYKNQAVLRADAYFTARSNESLGISSQGKALVQGMIEQIEALSGAGGEAIVKIEIAKHLKESGARFVVLGKQSADQGLEVRRLDANQLLSQLGVLEGLAPTQQKAIGSDVAVSAKQEPVKESAVVGQNATNSSEPTSGQ